MAVQDDFSLHEVERGLYLCRERFYVSSNQANIWIVKGSTKDLVIDTGIGLWDLPAFLKKSGAIGDKPYEAVATHVHFDHAGGLHQFEYFSIHRNEVRAITTGDNFESVTFVNEGEISKPPSPHFTARKFQIQPAQPSRMLDDGDLIDLGDRKLRVLHLPGHSRGSIALYEEATKTLFSGDIMYDGLIIDWLPYSNISDYLKSCQSLKALAPNVDRVCPGHFNTFDGQTLTRLLVNYIESVEQRCHDLGSRCLGAAATVVLKGRNTNNVPAKCCFFCCCCCKCLCL